MKQNLKTILITSILILINNAYADNNSDMVNGNCIMHEVHARHKQLFSATSDHSLSIINTTSQIKSFRLYFDNMYFKSSGAAEVLTKFETTITLNPNETKNINETLSKEIAYKEKGTYGLACSILVYDHNKKIFYASNVSKAYIS